MPIKRAIERARADKRAGKAASTQAGEFVRAEIDRIRRGKHGARNAKQAIAIGLSEARRAGVDLPPPRKGTTAKRTRRNAKLAHEAGQGKHKPARRPGASKSTAAALKSEPRSAASRSALSKQAKSASARRGSAARSAAAKKAVGTKGPAARSAAAKKAARTRARRSR